jgi:hypothetical protein
MRSIRLSALALAATALLPFPVFAGTESGFYLGAGIGQASVGDIEAEELGEVSFDGDDTGWKVFGGYNFGVIPLLDLAIEGGYVDFGNPDDTVGGTPLEVDANALALFGLAGANLGPVGVFAKLGMVSWDADLESPVGSASDDGTDPAYGIGGRLKFGSFEVRAEYEMFDVDAADDVYLLSASGVWTF